MATGFAPQDTGPPPQPPAGQARGGVSPAGKFVDFEQYIDAQLRHTRGQVKVTEVATGLLLLGVAVSVFFLLVAVADHWILHRGFNGLERFVLFAVLIGGCGYFFVRAILPALVSRVNPIYAAQAIERSKPTLKNSLINFLLFRRRPETVHAVVFKALQEQAATGLAKVPIETAVDRSRLIQLGYVLIGCVLALALYQVLSPKNPLVSAYRVLVPWSDVPAPSRVSINGIEPRDTNAFRGQGVQVSAEIEGLASDEHAVVLYTTADGQIVDRALEMSGAESNRYTAPLPEGKDGVQQDLSYRIEAGDTQSGVYHVKLVDAPTILVDHVDYHFPDYTGIQPNPTTVANHGDLKAVEGTIVTIHATANQPIKTASVDFKCDGKADKSMSVTGQTATATFVLSLNEARTAPQFDSYQLRMTNDHRVENPQPVRHHVEVVPDLAPEVAILSPEREEITIPLDGQATIEVRAIDPDFALAGVRLRAKTEHGNLFDEALLPDAPHAGPFVGKYQFDPTRLGLKAGDVVHYTAVAIDNKAPQANETVTPERRIRIAAADNAPRQQPNDANPNENGGSQPQKPGNQRNDDRPQPNHPQNNKPGENDQQRDPNQHPNSDRQNKDSPRNETQPNGDQKKDSPRNETPNSGDQPPPNDDQRSNDNQQQNGNQPPNKNEQPGDKNHPPSKGDQQNSEQPQNKPDQQNKSDGQQKNSDSKQGGQGGGSSSNSADGKSSQQGGGKSAQSGGGKSSSAESGQNSQSGGDHSSASPNGGSDSQSGAQQNSSASQKPTTPNQSAANQSADQQAAQNQSAPSQAGDNRQNSGAQKGNQQSQNSGQKPDGQGQNNHPGPSAQDQPPADPSPAPADGRDDGSGIERILDKTRNQQPQDGNSANNSQKADGENHAGKQPNNEPQTGNPANRESSSAEKTGGEKPGGDNSPQPSKAGSAESNQQQPKGPTDQDSKSPGSQQQPQGQGPQQPGGPQNSGQQQAADQKATPGQRQGPSQNQLPDGTKNDEAPKTPQELNRDNSGDPNTKKDDQPSAEQNVPQAESNKAQGGNPPSPPNPNQKHSDGSPGNPSERPSTNQSENPTPQNPSASRNNSNSNSGAGQDNKGGKGSPDQKEQMKPRDKQPGDSSKQGDPENDAQAAAKSNHESNSRGQQDGDKSGGGRSGGGQKADKQGKGQSGQNTPSDQGADRANEPGKGETSNNPGNDQKSDHPTGQQSNEKGNGSSSRPSSGLQQDQPPSSQQPGSDQGEGNSNQGKAQGNQPGAGKKPAAGGTQGNGANPGDQVPDAPGDSLQAGAAPAADDPNLAYAKKATELAIDRLKSALKHGPQADSLLHDLGWSRDEAQQFVQRQEERLRNAERPNPNDKLRREAEDTLRSLGLRPDRSVQKGGGVTSDQQRGLSSDRKTAPPPDYAEQFKAYTQGLNSNSK